MKDKHLDKAVDTLVTNMKTRLIEKELKGKRGWECLFRVEFNSLVNRKLKLINKICDQRMLGEITEEKFRLLISKHTADIGNFAALFNSNCNP